jgi:hypothetical protein
MVVLSTCLCYTMRRRLQKTIRRHTIGVSPRELLRLSLCPRELLRLSLNPRELLRLSLCPRELLRLSLCPSVAHQLSRLQILPPCGLVGGFRGTYCFHLQSWRWMHYVPPKLHVASQPRRSLWTFLPSWEPQMSYLTSVCRGGKGIQSVSTGRRLGGPQSLSGSTATGEETVPVHTKIRITAIQPAPNHFTTTAAATTTTTSSTSSSQRSVNKSEI